MAKTNSDHDKNAPAVTPCPPGCVEHRHGGPGDRIMNHSTAPRYVTGFSATKDHEVVTIGVWLEQREPVDGSQPAEVVGVIEKGKDDVELSVAQLRDFARHLLDVANQVDVATTARLFPVTVSAVSDNVGTTPLEVRTSGIAGRSVHLHTGTSGEDLMLQPSDARRLGEALIQAAG